MNTPHEPNRGLIYVDALVQQDPEWEPEEATLVIGDGSVVFDEDYDYDPRVYFYFDNVEQYEKAKTTMMDDVGFIVLRELEDEE